MKRFLSYFLLIFILVCTGSFACSAQQDAALLNSDSVAVVKTIDSFLDAFRNLDWEKFTTFFADDATAFFPPSAKFPYRANNKKEIESIFKTVFEHAKKLKSSPPYLSIEPKDTKIQLAASNAIVTFLLNDPDLLGRRTIIFKKQNDKWLIIHLHASGMAIPN